MGFFDFLKKSAEPAAPAAPAFPVTLAADAKGTVVAMENIPDEVFAQGILGKCCGIDPTEGKIYAPADGEVTQAPDSGHALGIMTTAGVEVLIHVGVDTVEMKGDGFSPKVKEGDKVKKGDLLLEMDLDKKTVTIDGEDVPFTKTEFELLHLFLSEKGHVFSRQELIDRIWPKDVLVLDRTVDVNITRLRKKIGRFAKCIVTRLGFGYYFDVL